MHTADLDHVGPLTALPWLAMHISTPTASVIAGALLAIAIGIDWWELSGATEALAVRLYMVAWPILGYAVGLSRYTIGEATALVDQTGLDGAWRGVAIGMLYGLGIVMTATYLLAMLGPLAGNIGRGAAGRVLPRIGRRGRINVRANLLGVAVNLLPVGGLTGYAYALVVSVSARLAGAVLVELGGHVGRML